MSGRRVERHELAEPVTTTGGEFSDERTTWSVNTPVCVLAELGEGGAEVRFPDGGVIVLDLVKLRDRAVPRRSRAKGTR